MDFAIALAAVCALWSLIDHHRVMKYARSLEKQLSDVKRDVDLYREDYDVLSDYCFRELHHE